MAVQSHKKNLCWRKAVQVAVCAAALVVGLSAMWSLQVASARCREDRRQEVIDVLSGALLRRMELEPGREREIFQSWAELVTGQADIVRVALLDDARHRVLVHPAEPFDDSTPKELAVPSGFVLHQRELSCLIDGKRITSLALLSLLGKDTAGGHSSGLLWPVVLATLAAAAGATWWLGRRFGTSATSHLVRVSQALGSAGDSPGDGDDEQLCARIIREVGLLQRQAADWEKETRRLQRVAETRVQAETRHLSTMLQRVEKKARKDSLTGLDNRHCLDGLLRELFESQSRSGRDLAIIMVDLDRFKNLNDTLGHQAGDDLLQFTGRLLLSHTRPQDLAVRYGGDEFMLVMKEMPCGEAAGVARRISQLFAQHTTTLRVQPKPTLSAGVATLRYHAPGNIQELINYADAALYHQKRAGRNGVFVLEPEAAAV